MWAEGEVKWSAHCVDLETQDHMGRSIGQNECLANVFSMNAAAV